MIGPGRGSRDVVFQLDRGGLNKDEDRQKYERTRKVVVGKFWQPSWSKSVRSYIEWYPQKRSALL